MKRPIAILDDGTEIILTTGDVDAFRYGGGVVFKRPHTPSPFWTFWRARGRGEKNYSVFTAPLPPDILDHFSVNLKELSLVSGMDYREIKRNSRSRSCLDRLIVVDLIVECNGASSVDPSHAPKNMTPHDLSIMWGAVFGSDSSSVPILDYEDFILRTVAPSGFECGTVDGVYLGRHLKYKTALCAIADYMKSNGRGGANVFREVSRGQLEHLSWHPDSFSGKLCTPAKRAPSAFWRKRMSGYVSSEIRRKRINENTKLQKSVFVARGRATARAKRKLRIRSAEVAANSIERSRGD